MDCTPLNPSKMQNCAETKNRFQNVTIVFVKDITDKICAMSEQDLRAYLEQNRFLYEQEGETILITGIANESDADSFSFKFPM